MEEICITFLFALGGDQRLLGLLADLELDILAARLVSEGCLWLRLKIGVSLAVPSKVEAAVGMGSEGGLRV